LIIARLNALISHIYWAIGVFDVKTPLSTHIYKIKDPRRET